MSDVLVRCENVGKKFCRDLRTSLWHGVTDIINDLTGNLPKQPTLRAKEFWANNRIDFTLKRGESLGLVGSNGAGKTTLLKMLSGLIKPDAGRLTVRGRVNSLIALGAGFNPILSGRENIYANGAVLGLSVREINSRFEEITEFAELTDSIDAPVRTYSSGMTARLGFAVAACMKPDILLVDEVLAVGDVKFRMKCYEVMQNRLNEGTAVILVSHNETDLARVCNRGLYLRRGSQYFQGSLSKAMSEYRRNYFKDSQKSLQQHHVVKFNDCRLTDRHGTSLARIETFDEVHVRLDIYSPQHLDNVRLLFHVDSPNHGTLFSGSSFPTMKNINIPEGNSSITLEIPSVKLLQGLYQFRFDIYGKSISDLYGLAPPIFVDVVTTKHADAFGYGYCHAVYFDHEWNVNGLRISQSNA